VPDVDDVKAGTTVFTEEPSEKMMFALPWQLLDKNWFSSDKNSYWVKPTARGNDRERRHRDPRVLLPRPPSSCP